MPRPRTGHYSFGAGPPPLSASADIEAGLLNTNFLAGLLTACHYAFGLSHQSRSIFGG